jgi:hypothetical protein
MWARVMTVAGLAVSASLLPSAAGAQNVFVGLSNTGLSGSFTTEASGSGNASISAFTFGSFEVQASGTGAPILTLPSLAGSNTLDVTNEGGGGTLFVAISTTGNNTPLSSIGSSFTSNSITTGWTVTESTFLDTGNTKYAETTPLGGPVVFTAINTPGTQGPVNTGTTTGSDYSVTMLYEIQAPTSDSPGNTNDTIDMTGVPAPSVGAPGPIQGAGIPGIALAVGFFGLLTLRRRGKGAAQIKSV